MRKCIIMVFIFVGLSMAQQSKFSLSIGGLYVDEAYGIIQTADSGYALTGYTSSYGAGGYDMIVSKFDRVGQHVWTRVIGGTGNEYAYSLVETSDNNIVIVGSTSSFGAGGGDIMLVKVDANGTLLWAKTIGGTNSDFARHMIQTSDKGFAFTGGTESYGFTHRDIFVVKLDSLGNFSWATTMGWNYGLTPSSEDGRAITQTYDNGYAITGISWSFGSNDAAMVLCKLDASGTYLWHRNLGATGGFIGDVGNFVIETYFTDLFVVGETEAYDVGGGRDLFLTKFDSSGTHIWTRTWGGFGFDAALSVVLDQNNELVVSGLTQSFGPDSNEIMLSKFDLLGNHLWSRVIGGLNPDKSYSIALTNDNGYAITGSTESFGVDSVDIILVKCDSIGFSCIESTVNHLVGSPSPSIGTQDPTVTYPTPIMQDTIPDVSNITPSINVICESILPDNFNLLSPPDSTTLEIARPTFFWNASYDALSGIKSYEVYICDTLRTTCMDTFWTADYNLSEEYNDWYVIAYDSLDNSRQSNQTWTVIIDTSGPFIDSTTIWEDTSYSGPFPVYANVTGLNNIDIVRLYYKKMEDPVWFFKNMIEGTDNWYYEEIPIASRNNDTIKYYIYAADTLPDEATDPLGAPSNYYSFVARMVSGIEEDNGIPGKFYLSVNSLTKDRAIFGFSLPGKATISLVVYDVTGRSIWELNSVEYSPGYYELPFVPQRKGVYFYEFSSPYNVEKGKLVIF